jgi:hypothetical protein
MFGHAATPLGGLTVRVQSAHPPQFGSYTADGQAPLRH